MSKDNITVKQFKNKIHITALRYLFLRDCNKKLDLVTKVSDPIISFFRVYNDENLVDEGTSLEKAVEEYNKI